MGQYAKAYQRNFVALLESVKCADYRGSDIDAHEGIETVCGLMMRQSDLGAKIICIGNGGSAAIASHFAIDLWKNGRIKSLAFNDGALLTCISNDFGYEHVFEKPIEFFAEGDDVLFAVSSSGKSENIIRAVRAAKLKGCSVITLSGFGEDNPLRLLGTYNFYVPSSEYGFVEVIHQYLCHCISDIAIAQAAISARKAVKAGSYV